MPEIPEKYKTLREITDAIARADAELAEVAQHGRLQLIEGLLAEDAKVHSLGCVARLVELAHSRVRVGAGAVEGLQVAGRKFVEGVLG